MATKFGIWRDFISWLMLCAFGLFVLWTDKILSSGAAGMSFMILFSIHIHIFSIREDLLKLRKTVEDEKIQKKKQSKNPLERESP